MLDIKFIRDNPDLIKEAARKKHLSFNVDELLKAETERRRLLREVETMRAAQNQAGEQVARAANHKEKIKSLVGLKELKEKLQQTEADLTDVMKQWRVLMLRVPNIPDVSVPEGTTEADNKEVKVWGQKSVFDFPHKNHLELAQALDLADLEVGSRVAGFRGYFLKNDGALLSFALWQLALAHFSTKGLAPLLVPSLVKRETLLGTGYLPGGEEDLYKTQDGDYLAGTAEVATMAYHADSVIPRERLPIKQLSFSVCFRREAGSHGKDTRGLMRVHEFYKWEQVVLCEANHEASVKYHEWLNRNTEELIEKLNLPYRTVINCGADLGLGQVKKYDIELWIPSEDKYREISSASYFHDFQSRRLNIRYLGETGKPRFAHSLNSTALPTPRLLIAILENYQQPNGTVVVPDVLQKYLGKKVLCAAGVPNRSTDGA